MVTVRAAGLTPSVSKLTYAPQVAPSQACAGAVDAGARPGAVAAKGCSKRATKCRV